MASSHTPLHARISARHWPVTGIAVALAVAGAVLVGSWAGWSAVADAVADVRIGWIGPIVVLICAAVGGYALAYQAVSRLDHGPDLGWRSIVRVVTAGFGPFAVAGGFAVDQRFLTGMGTPRRHARVLVLGLGALEYGVLAPAACVCSVILLIEGSSVVQGALLWSWAIAVPIGFAIGLWLAAPRYRERIEPRTRPRAWLRDALNGVGLLRELLRHPVRHAGAWVGMAIYWAAAIAAMYASLRLFGTRLDTAHVVVGFATGYALTRRSMPLGGAGATEILMSLALHWVGVPLAHALPAVVAYRLATFVLPAVPAMHSHRRISLG